VRSLPSQWWTCGACGELTRKTHFRITSNGTMAHVEPGQLFPRQGEPPPTVNEVEEEPGA
jgi:hypothetical protein